MSRDASGICTHASFCFSGVHIQIVSYFLYENMCLFRDAGSAAYLTRRLTPQALACGAVSGAVPAAFVISGTLISYANRGVDCRCCASSYQGIYLSVLQRIKWKTHANARYAFPCVVLFKALKSIWLSPCSASHIAMPAMCLTTVFLPLTTRFFRISCTFLKSRAEQTFPTIRLLMLPA